MLKTKATKAKDVISICKKTDLIFDSILRHKTSPGQLPV